MQNDTSLFRCNYLFINTYRFSMWEMVLSFIRNTVSTNGDRPLIQWCAKVGVRLPSSPFIDFVVVEEGHKILAVG
jgi:hypothetical protein